MKTVRGIELNLKESSYNYQFLGFTFFFSSLFYLEKYKREVQEYIKIESMRLCNKYKVPIAMNIYFAIAFYKKIEKRGFRIIDNSKNIEVNHILFTSNLI